MPPIDHSRQPSKIYLWLKAVRAETHSTFMTWYSKTMREARVARVCALGPLCNLKCGSVKITVPKQQTKHSLESQRTPVLVFFVERKKNVKFGVSTFFSARLPTLTAWTASKYFFSNPSSRLIESSQCRQQQPKIFEQTFGRNIVSSQTFLLQNFPSKPSNYSLSKSSRGCVHCSFDKTNWTLF